MTWGGWPMNILYIENHCVFAHTVVQAFLSGYRTTVVPSIKLAKKYLNKINNMTLP
jgi:hypothetical protein